MTLTFPKIFALGTPYTARLFNGPVEVTEKIDGSQFNFRLGTDGVLTMRSKGAEVHPETADKNFRPVVDWVLSIRDRLVPGAIYHGETLARPRHNILTYGRVPRNHFALFGHRRPDGAYLDHDGLRYVAQDIGCEVVPCLFMGHFSVMASELGKEPLEIYREWLDQESFLGGQKIEGFVIKNYAESVLLGGNPMTPLSAKYVSEAFKEKHKKEWESGPDKLAMLISQYQSKARWHKAIQHLRDKGELEQSPRDIGKLIKEVQIDLVEECRDEIRDELFKLFIDQIKRTAIRGLPEFYKELLAAGQLSDAA